jgi:flagellar biosynthesis GTPase FlhF
VRIKSYRAESVESAIRRARVELGAEAILLDSRRALADSGEHGPYEVRFALAGEPGPPAAACSEDSLAQVTQSLDEMRRLLYSYTRPSYLPAGKILHQPQLVQIYRQVTGQEVEPELAAELVAGLVPWAEQGASTADLEERLAEELRHRVPSAPRIGRLDQQPEAAAFVGPPGAGKTATIAKLAVQLGIEQDRRVRLVTMDHDRVGALDQIRRLAGILGVELTAVESARELAEVLDGFRAAAIGPEVALIDTPGLGFQDFERAAELAGLLSEREEVEVHLVLAASTKPADLRRLVERFSVFGAGPLLFTKLDETLSFGSLINESTRSGRALSYFGTGQRIPEDLQPATGGAVADLLLNRRSRAAAR